MVFDAVIVGAGISGLVAAHRLKRKGYRVALLEAGERAGGVIQTERVDDFLIERGPNSLRGTHALLDLVDELDLRNELRTGDPKAPAYIYADGQLQQVPMHPLRALRTGLIPLTAKLRLLAEPLIPQRNQAEDESIDSFIRRRLGTKVLENLVAPFVAGVYAGDVTKLSIAATFPTLKELERGSGSIVRGMLKQARAHRAQAKVPAPPSLRAYRLCSFRNGLETLTNSLAASLGDDLKYGVKIAALDEHVNAGLHKFSVTADAASQRSTLKTSNLILAIPAFSAATLLERLAPEMASQLAAIRYNSLACVPIALKLADIDVRPDGFGFLAAPRGGLRILGSIWNSSVFTERAPEGWLLTTTFIGGATDPDAVNLSDNELVETVVKDLATVMGLNGGGRTLPIARYAHAIPQYELGHVTRVAKIESELKAFPGLHLAGNYLHGVSLGDCIDRSLQIADEVERVISNRHT